ncbi:hypothetical protein DL93DRAFT_1885577 [Clavulina sp. PMI_390]|nr:hypothetical protein DL93DRAFT_1885577 [Clavulina sp. PMI_390]
MVWPRLDRSGPFDIFHNRSLTFWTRGLARLFISCLATRGFACDRGNYDDVFNDGLRLRHLRFLDPQYLCLRRSTYQCLARLPNLIVTWAHEHPHPSNYNSNYQRQHFDNAYAGGGPSSQYPPPHHLHGGEPRPADYGANSDQQGHIAPNVPVEPEVSQNELHTPMQRGSSHLHASESGTGASGGAWGDEPTPIHGTNVGAATERPEAAIPEPHPSNRINGDGPRPHLGSHPSYASVHHTPQAATIPPPRKSSANASGNTGVSATEKLSADAGTMRSAMPTDADFPPLPTATAATPTTSATPANSAKWKEDGSSGTAALGKTAKKTKAGKKAKGGATAASTPTAAPSTQNAPPISPSKATPIVNDDEKENLNTNPHLSIPLPASHEIAEHPLSILADSANVSLEVVPPFSIRASPAVSRDSSPASARPHSHAKPSAHQDDSEAEGAFDYEAEAAAAAQTANTAVEEVEAEIERSLEGQDKMEGKHVDGSSVRSMARLLEGLTLDIASATSHPITDNNVSEGRQARGKGQERELTLSPETPAVAFDSTITSLATLSSGQDLTSAAASGGPGTISMTPSSSLQTPLTPSPTTLRHHDTPRKLDVHDPHAMGGYPTDIGVSIDDPAVTILEADIATNSPTATVDPNPNALALELPRRPSSTVSMMSVSRSSRSRPQSRSSYQGANTHRVFSKDGTGPLSDSLFIGGLDPMYGWTESKLREVFSKYGTVEGVRVIFKGSESGSEQRKQPLGGHGFVQFVGVDGKEREKVMGDAIANEVSFDPSSGCCII